MAVKMNKTYCGDGFPNLPDFDAMESGGGGASAGLIAYEQKTLKADKAYTAGDNFIYDGVIYAVTANIAKDADIVLEGAGANVEALDPVQEQINDLEESIPTPINYSTTEQDTGILDTDGKHVYVKSFALTFTPGSIVDIGAIDNVYAIKKIDSVATYTYSGSTTTVGLPFTVSDNNLLMVYYENTTGRIKTNTNGTAYTGATGFATVYYTKTE